MQDSENNYMQDTITRLKSYASMKLKAHKENWKRQGRDWKQKNWRMVQLCEAR